MDDLSASHSALEGETYPLPVSVDTPLPDEATAPTKKKIVFVITKGNWGGAQRYVFDLASETLARGYAVTVLYGEHGLLVDKLTAQGIHTIALPTLTRDIDLKSEWASFKELRRIIAEEKPDLLHVNSSKAGLALIAGRLTQVPRIIFTAHGFAFNEDRPWWQRLVLRALYAVTVLCTHKTICVSDAVKDDIAWVPFTQQKLIVIKNGVDIPHFFSRKDARKKLEVHTTKKVWLGMLAELHPTKRVIDAVYALGELRKEHPDVALVVIGEGSERAHLEETITRLGMNDCVFLVGFKDGGASYLHAFDIFLMPSRSEALAYALIEAGFAGLPSIASRVGGMKEVIWHKDNGLLVPAQNPHSLARAIRTLLEHPAVAKEYGKKLKGTTTERFSKERMLTETFSSYES